MNHAANGNTKRKRECRQRTEGITAISSRTRSKTREAIGYQREASYSSRIAKHKNSRSRSANQKQENKPPGGPHLRHTVLRHRDPALNITKAALELWLCLVWRNIFRAFGLHPNGQHRTLTSISLAQAMHRNNCLIVTLLEPLERVIIRACTHG